MAPSSLLHILLFLLCTSPLVLCRDLSHQPYFVVSSENPSLLGASSHWRYYPSPYDVDVPSERSGEHYTRHSRRQEPEEEERYFDEDEEERYHAGHYDPRPHYYRPDEGEEEDRPEYRRRPYHREGGEPGERYEKPRRTDRERYPAGHGYEEEGEGEEDEEQRYRHGARHEKSRHYEYDEPERETFVVDDRSFQQETIVSTDAGEMTIILPRDLNKNEFAKRKIGLSLLTLEPKALLLPHYTNTHYLFVVYKGKGRISWVDGDNLHEIDLEEGDVYKIESGTLFYLINADTQTLKIFGTHDVTPGDVTTKRLQFHTFFVAGGWNLGNVLSGFREDVLATAFNASGDDVYDILSSRVEEPIIYQVERNESKQEQPSMEKKEGEPSATQEPSEGERKASATRSDKPPSAAGTSLMELPLQKELFDVADILLEVALENPVEELQASQLHRVVENAEEADTSQNAKTDTPQKPLNILQKKPIFSNEYGTTTVADENDFAMLKDVDKGLFSVKLKAGAILAPHWNPRAMEIGLVTEGEGEIQVVYPDGRKASIGRLTKGSIFYVPQNYVMCQIASRNGVLEFLGFSTSSRPSNPQFLAGSNSVLRKLNPGLLASSFDVPVEHMQKFLDKQHQAVVLPGREEQKQKPRKREH